MDLLTRSLVDDAAIFPPGLAPVRQAVEDHQRWRSVPLGRRLGPLLLSAPAVTELRDLLIGDPSLLASSDLPIGVVARPGTPLDTLREAVDRVQETAGLELVGVELAPTEGWEGLLELDLPVALELPRDPEAAAAQLSELAGHRARGAGVVAKWRTQSSPAGPVPTPDELAGFLTTCWAARVPFKLTGGLHHAVARTAPAQSGEGTEEMHGALNVALATLATVRGAGPEEVAAVLDERDGAPLASSARQLDEDAAAAIRAQWVSFGCCGVTDPLDELAGLGLLDPADLTRPPA